MVNNIEEKIKNGEWISFKEYSPVDFGLDWVLVQFIENSGFIGLPYIAEIGSNNLWHINIDDVNTEYYLNNDCYASSWKIIEQSPEWKQKYNK